MRGLRRGAKARSGVASRRSPVLAPWEFARPVLALFTSTRPVLLALWKSTRPILAFWTSTRHILAFCGLVLLLVAAPAGAQSVRMEAVADRLADRFSDEEIELLEMLNRVDRERLPRLDSILVPESDATDPLAWSPFPRELPELREESGALLVHQPLQVYAAYEEGELVRWGPVSTGRREHPTPEGRFHLNWRSRGRYSTVNPEWYLEWYFNFHNRRGISFHMYELPGEPASHACVRLLERDARWIYEWGEEWELDERGWEVLDEGTPVWILGEYDFDRPPPWRDGDRLHPAISEEELRALLSEGG